MRPSLYELAGGPADFSGGMSDQTSMLRLHAGNGPGMLDLGRRFVDCFTEAADDAGLPEDPEFRAALRAYMEWATSVVDAYADPDAVVPEGLRMPRWGWDGLVTDGR